MEMKRRSILVLAILIMASLPVLPLWAETVDTTANVAGAGGATPSFMAKWELDDDDLYKPDTQVAPVPFGELNVTCYMVVEDDNGASDIKKVWIKVLHPDGTVKYEQLDAWELIDDDAILAIDEGVYYGLIDPDLAEIMKAKLVQDEARAYAVDILLHYHQPAGWYTVWAYAVDSWGNTGTTENCFEYLGIKIMAIDFAGGLDFGEIVPSSWKVLSGDKNMSTPDKPTVQSGGNLNVTISVSFSVMYGDYLGKEIEDFDAVFRGEHISFTAGPEGVTFSNPLLSCHTELIDFSIHAPYGTPVDTYRGTMEILIS